MSERENKGTEISKHIPQIQNDSGIATDSSNNHGIGSHTAKRERERVKKNKLLRSPRLAEEHCASRWVLTSCVCVRESYGKLERECVCVCERESYGELERECVCVCVCEKELWTAREGV